MTKSICGKIDVVIKRPFPSVLLVLLLIALPLATQAQTKATLPYSMVSSYLELFKSLENLDLISPSMMITSTNRKVAPQSIEFKIKVANDWLTFNPDENGVIEFPEKPDWASLVFLSNQPKGTLQLVIGFSAKPLSSPNMSYQELMALVTQFDEALAALEKTRGQAPQKVKGLTIQMPEGSGAAVHVLSKKGKKTLKPYATGVVVMKYSDALWQENPAVELDELPIGIVPLL